jgi:NADH-quinone oxidoreductase subunit E
MLQEKFGPEIEALVARYPARRSAVLPVLYMAQDIYKELTPDAIREVAEVLDMSYTDVFEVVGFYTLLYDLPVGKWMIQVCDDVPCCYLGAEELISTLKQKLNIREDQTSADGMFTLQRVKCLAACHRAPVVQANLCYIYDVTADMADALLRHLQEISESEQISSVSGKFAEDFEPVGDGTFRMLERAGGPVPPSSSAKPGKKTA